MQQASSPNATKPGLSQDAYLLLGNYSLVLWAFPRHTHTPNPNPKGVWTAVSELPSSARSPLILSLRLPASLKRSENHPTSFPAKLPKHATEK